ncbi:hypothetical protein TNCV_906531 [Trichonephila clavipes]|nr:hypothetical protein TNCV_906531 [Trichonephila clavipes]
MQPSSQTHGAINKAVRHMVQPTKPSHTMTQPTSRRTQNDATAHTLATNMEWFRSPIRRITGRGVSSREKLRQRRRKCTKLIAKAPVCDNIASSASGRSEKGDALPGNYEARPEDSKGCVTAPCSWFNEKSCLLLAPAPPQFWASSHVGLRPSLPFILSRSARSLSLAIDLIFAVAFSLRDGRNRPCPSWAIV